MALLTEIDRRDLVMAAAIERAGPLVERHPEKDSFLEALLEQSIGRAVAELVPGSEIAQTGGNRAEIPGWDRRLGDFDLKIRLPDEERPSVVVEAKVDDVGHTLWDLFKLTTVPRIHGAVAGYLVVAARRSSWARGGEVFALYDPEQGTPRRSVARMLVEWNKTWRELTGPNGGVARPTALPAFVETRFIGASAVRAFPDYEIRCIRVHRVGATDIERGDVARRSTPDD